MKTRELEVLLHERPSRAKAERLRRMAAEIVDELIVMRKALGAEHNARMAWVAENTPETENAMADATDIRTAIARYIAEEDVEPAGALTSS